MKNLVAKLFGRPARNSREDAKKRLKVLLIHDQVDLTPAQMEAMKAEIMEVIARYVQIDPINTEFRLERADGQVALVSTVPVTRVVERPATA